MANNKPAAEFRDGRLKAVIWRNEGENGAFYSTDIIRGYKDKDDNWQDAKGGFSGSENLRVARLLGKAHDREIELRANDRAAQAEDAGSE